MHCHRCRWVCEVGVYFYCTSCFLISSNTTIILCCSILFRAQCYFITMVSINLLIFMYEWLLYLTVIVLLYSYIIRTLPVFQSSDNEIVKKFIGSITYTNLVTSESARQSVVGRIASQLVYYVSLFDIYCICY